MEMAERERGRQALEAALEAGVVVGGSAAERRAAELVSDLELEGARALVGLSQGSVVIPGEDSALSRHCYRELTAATLAALALPLPLRDQALEEMFVRCESRGWRLLMMRGPEGWCAVRSPSGRNRWR